MPTIMQHDETETGPHIRKTLVDIHGVKLTLEREDIGGVVTRDHMLPKIDIYSYARPSNGQTMWLVEAVLFFPPDIQLWRSYVMDGSPSDEQAREIVASDAQKGTFI